jgi:MFS family permease
MVAGLVDSLCLSVAWTILVLQVNDAYGLDAAGFCSAAMLVGVALSAPVAGWMARHLSGRRLLRTAAGVEAVLRLGVFLLLFSGAPVWLLALCVSAMNVTAWTGYAGMRAEVAATSPGPAALTWYGTVVAAVEAVGVAVAAALPATGGGPDAVLVTVVAAYVLALVPTVVVAGGSPVLRAQPVRTARARRQRRRVSPPAAAGVLLMAVASAPTLLSVALAAEMHGRHAVGPAAIAFTIGSLAAPSVAARVDRRDGNNITAWVICAVGMLLGWLLAPFHVAMLCVAQGMSGLCMTTLEGLLDATAAHRNPGQVTGALARATAGRALGSAAGTAALPLLVLGVGLQATVGVMVLGLVGVLTGVCLVAARRTPASRAGSEPARLVTGAEAA